MQYITPASYCISLTLWLQSPYRPYAEATSFRNRGDNILLHALHIHETILQPELAISLLSVHRCLKEDKRGRKCTPLYFTLNNAFLEKLIFPQLVKKFPASYGTRSLITLFKISHLWSLSWNILIQFKPYHISLRVILTMSSEESVSFPSGILPSGLLSKILY
jgi:hypothetical protein